MKLILNKILYQNSVKHQVWQQISVIPATWEADLGGPWFEASMGKKVRP
jgi:hypothetical protein